MLRLNTLVHEQAYILECGGMMPLLNCGLRNVDCGLRFLDAFACFSQRDSR